MKNHEAILMFGTTLLVLIDVFALIVEHPFRWVSPLYLLMIPIFYLIAKKFKISDVGFLLLTIFVIFCNLGTLGLHSQYFFGIRFDRWVHALSGLVFGIVFYEIYKMKRIDSVILMTIVSVMIIGIIHEINEFFFVLSGLNYINSSYLVGAFFDFYDSAADLIYDFIGVLLALLVIEK